MKARVLIADDEPLARERLALFLSEEADVELVGQAANGSEALQMIESLHPDVVFLDVQMPELTGFEVIEQLSPTERPIVVFVTAYDQFAVKAFEVHAVDYLLKPFDKARFQTALKRAVSQIVRDQPAQIHQQLSALLNDLRPRSAVPDRIAIKS